MTALVVLGGLVAYPAASADRLAAIVIGLGAAAWALAALGIAVRWLPLVVAAVVLFGAEYALYLRLGSDVVDARAPLLAGGLIAAVELALRATAPAMSRGERSLVIRDVLAIAFAACGAALVAGFVLVAAGSFTSGLVLEVLGAAAGVLAVGIVAQVARSSSSTST